MTAKSAKSKAAAGKTAPTKTKPLPGKARKAAKAKSPRGDKPAAPVRAEKVEKKETAKKSLPAKRAPKSSAAVRKPQGKTAAPSRALHPKKLDEFREQLLLRHRELMQAYTSAKGDSRSRQDDGTEDYIDYAVSSYDREFLLSLTEMEQRELMLVEDALRRLERGEFGNCMQCGKQIPAKRLEVQPWARYCVSCQELEDRGLLERSELDADEDETEKPVLTEDEEPALGQEVEFHGELEVDEDASEENDEENLGL